MPRPMPSIFRKVIGKCLLSVWRKVFWSGEKAPAWTHFKTNKWTLKILFGAEGISHISKCKYMVSLFLLFKIQTIAFFAQGTTVLVLPQRMVRVSMILRAVHHSILWVEIYLPNVHLHSVQCTASKPSFPPVLLAYTVPRTGIARPYHF